MRCYVAPTGTVIAAFVTVSEDCLGRQAGGRRKGQGRVTHRTGVDGIGAKRFQQWCCIRELASHQLVGQVVEHACSFHHGARIAALIADTQPHRMRERRGIKPEKRHQEVGCPRCTLRSATSVPAS